MDAGWDGLILLSPFSFVFFITSFRLLLLSLHLSFFLLHHARLLLLPSSHPLLLSLIPETHVRRVRKIERKKKSAILQTWAVCLLEKKKKKVRLDDPDGLVTQCMIANACHRPWFLCLPKLNLCLD